MKSHMNSSSKLRIVVPGSCQFRCLACHNEHNCDKFTFNRLRFRQALEYLSSRDTIEHANISGGEPLHPDNIGITKEIMAITRSFFPKCSLSINTNGFNLTNSVAEWLRANAEYVKVSLYAVTEGDYLSYTGVEALTRVTRGIETLLSSGVSVKINALATKYTVNPVSLEALLRFAVSRRIPIKFVELITHEWFSEQSLQAWEDLSVSPQEIERRLGDLGAIMQYSLFDRTVMRLGTSTLEIYRYPRSSEETALYRRFGWGSFLRADGRIHSIRSVVSRETGGESVTLAAMRRMSALEWHVEGTEIKEGPNNALQSDYLQRWRVSGNR